MKRTEVLENAQLFNVNMIICILPGFLNHIFIKSSHFLVGLVLCWDQKTLCIDIMVDVVTLFHF